MAMLVTDSQGLSGEPARGPFLQWRQVHGGLGQTLAVEVLRSGWNLDMFYFYFVDGWCWELNLCPVYARQGLQH